MKVQVPFHQLLVLLILFGLIIPAGHGCKVNQSTKTVNETPGDNGETEVEDPDPPKVLFIGSSYFAYNGFIEMFKNMINAGGKSLDIHTRIVSGAYLSYHVGSSESIAKIYEEDWDYVLLQGGCHYISKPLWHPEIIPYIKELNKLIKYNCETTKTIYLMPWAYEDGLAWMYFHTESYMEMQQLIYNEAVKLAHEINIGLAPVGWAWKDVFQSKEYYIDMYQPDYNHPSFSGTYLMACVFYSTLFQERVDTVNYFHGIPEDKARFMQRVASDTVMNDLETWNLLEDE